MGQPHIWSKELHAWAEGEIIQSSYIGSPFIDTSSPAWDHPDYRFRVKPKPEYPTCNISLRDIAQLICHDVGNSENFVLDYQVALRKITNAAIRRSIEDGQVTIVEK